MTAASGGPGEKPDYPGHPPSGSDVPRFDPAYGSGYPPPPPAYPPFPGYPPQYGAPMPGYPGYPGYPGAAEPRTNVLAIVSLVSSASGLLCFLGSLVGIITGAIAIAQIKRTGGRGFGLAVAGVAAGVAGLVVYVVMVAYALQQR